ncbi:hypothetical protein [Aeromonas sp. HZM]|uniref:hypothetical protein n=1 Tax=Aeromonas sp. HZM TaxID=1454008 RepID=UPI000A545AAF|nr:hypothetical protein [Aeromonas sp. HZM]
MNKVERFVYDFVKKNAILKNAIVKLYQLPFSIIGRSKGRINSDYEYLVYEDSFFGFHDKPSLNAQKKLLSHTEDSDFICGMGRARINVVDIESSKSIISGLTTKCCNYQQGSMLAWYKEDSFIYNDSNDIGNPVTRVVDLNGKLLEEFNFHFCSISKSGEYISSINYCRFGIGMPGYGYDIEYPQFYTDDATINIPESGVSDLLILETKGHKILKRFSINELLHLSVGLLKNGYFYFSHTSFSPLSKKMFFLLRSSNKYTNTSQLFVYDIQKDSLITIPTGGMVSHLSWLDENNIVLYCNNTKGEDSYYCASVENDMPRLDALNISSLTSDGHPYCFSNKKEFITDNYPDRERRQSLKLINITSKSETTLLDIYSPSKFRGVVRVDLHPRLSEDENYITIDSSHLNKRCQVVLKL